MRASGYLKRAKGVLTVAEMNDILFILAKPRLPLCYGVRQCEAQVH